MKIRDLKCYLEFICGIPYNIQKLCYLDEGQLADQNQIQYYDIINGATINMVNKIFIFQLKLLTEFILKHI